MPEALATSKRKFHKLLDSLTPPAPHSSISQSSPPSSSPPNKENVDASTPPAAKRPRLEPKSRRTPTTIRSSAGNAATTTAISSSRNRFISSKMKDKPRDAANNEEPPNYVPWSHELFLERLKTFADVLIWTSKPDAVNEEHWAKRGWICESVNRVACKGGCERRLAIVLRPKRKDKDGFEIEGSEDYSVDVDEGLIKRYQELIVTAHDESCLWRLDGCKDDIYRLPIARPSIWQPQLHSRYHSFNTIADSVPSTTQLTQSLDIPFLASHLPSDLIFEQDNTSDTSDTRPQTLDHRFLAFSLHGWQAHPSTHNPTATCAACFRRIPLWLFQALPASDAEGSEEAREEPRKLDLRENHRDYCPWVNGASQCMPGDLHGLPAWQILEKVVRNWITRRLDDSAEDDTASNGQNGEGSAAAGKQDPHRPADGSGGAGGDFSNTPSTSRPASSGQRSREEVEKQDKERFARLRELTRGLARMRKRRDRVGEKGLTG